ncbi:potassium transporter [Alginatibacterium sediminis]|uniref:Potassium transporter n=1 Tax=Alginatibacterium sediminis TaxID=2164068 RepID=A0A420E5K9_9ALTE|nr:monovalent cation:proton antiporter-2 (CPA2) family protein [Alginatibacterium sediminis]RKF12798.1 potassium transporter [Alginatibacterium sediminis]
MEHNVLLDAFVYLAATIIAVPVAKRLGFGSVLGYLLAGILIGPFVLNFVGNQSDVMHVAEFGVVMMLFLIGLELNPKLLYRMRLPIMGYGGAQVGLTLLMFMALGLGFGMDWREALSLGMILALSSTAIVLQSLQEKGQLKTIVGRKIFAVLLFQDIAVIPMLAILPLLSTQSGELSNSTSGISQAIQVTAVIAGIVVGGHYVLRHLFRFVAKTGSRELFVASALAVVVGVSLAMTWAGLSPALGAFLAGLVLADCEYRHEIESDIEPFKGLLLGLFFISIGAGINFDLLWFQPVLIAACVCILMLGKLLILYVVGLIFGFSKRHNSYFSVTLAQGGEFAFVLAGAALSYQVIDLALLQLLVLVVTLSMLLTPIALIVYDKFLAPRFTSDIKREADHIDESNPVIIAGFGRFGQIVGRLLHGYDIGTTILEHDASQIETLRKFNYTVFYGEATRLDLLISAGAEDAKLLVVALDDPESTLQVVSLAKRHFPNLQIIARAIDRKHARQLEAAGIDYCIRETFESSVALGVKALELLGYRANQAFRAGQVFKRYDQGLLSESVGQNDEERQRVSRSMDARNWLNALLQDDDLTARVEKEDHAFETEMPVKETGRSARSLLAGHKHNKTSR